MSTRPTGGPNEMAPDKKFYIFIPTLYNLYNLLFYLNTFVEVFGLSPIILIFVEKGMMYNSDILLNISKYAYGNGMLVGLNYSKAVHQFRI